jgi:Peptidase M50B-like
MKHAHQVLLIGAFLPLCWLALMAVHELGHVIGAVATGGTIERVVLHPLAISRTDVFPNPNPMLVVWAGPLLGAVLPLGLLLTAKVAKFRWAYLIQFFEGFCLIANGAYIGVGSFGRIGDAGDMLRRGSPMWCLWLFGVTSLPLGVWLWNGLGPHFGLGQAAGKVEHHAAYISCVLLILTVIVEVALSQ